MTTETKRTPLQDLMVNPRRRSKTYTSGDRFLTAVLEVAPAAVTGPLFGDFGITPHRCEDLGTNHLQEILKDHSGVPDDEEFM